MTLFRQLFGGIALLLALLFAGFLWLNVSNTRDFLDQQLSAHAQDTATSLGVSLSPYLKKVPQMARIEGLANAVFDRGFYQSLQLTSVQGEVLLARTNPAQIDGVPAWFMRWFPLQPPTASTEINNGWNIAGTLVITAHAGYAYEELWGNTLGMFLMMLVAFFLACLLGWWLLQIIMRPLHQIEEQAKAICAGEFRELPELAKTRELRRVQLAINRMTNSLRRTFASLGEQALELRQRAYTDPVTGLDNRAAFELLLNERLRDTATGADGFVWFVRLPNLRELNQAQGYQAGDNYLQQVCDQLKSVFAGSPKVRLFRLSGAEFAVLQWDVVRESVQELAQNLSQRLQANASSNVSSNEKTGAQATLDRAQIGITGFSAGQALATVLSTCDSTTTTARHGRDGYQIANRLDAAPVIAYREWTQLIGTILQQQTVSFLGHGVHLEPADALLYTEMLARFPAQTAAGLGVGQLFAMAERGQQAGALDRLIVSAAIKALSGDVSVRGHYAINLGMQALTDADFRVWLDDRLRENPAIAARLWFELAETTVVCALDAATDLRQRLHLRGSRFVIGDFGLSLASLSQLPLLHPEAIKLDGSLVRALDSHDHHHLTLVKTLVHIGASLGVQVIAAQVETDAELQALKRLGISAHQGYFLSKPKPLC